MADNSATAAAIGGVALLERAINYTLGSLLLVTPRLLSRPTPCSEWDLRALLSHMNDSFDALCEAVDDGWVSLTPSAYDRDADPVGRLRDKACRLIGSWTSNPPDLVAVAGCPVTATIVTTAGAMEVVVHGWDVAEACGQRRRIPDELAEELLELAPLFVTDADRDVRFAPPLTVLPDAGPGVQLLAFLGRRL
jgi:uncharacterized protein (TIGR03086 family)